MKSITPMKDPRGYLTDEECLKILGRVKGRDYVLIYTLLRTGRRVSEVIGNTGVRPIDINERDNIIRWRILKKKDPIYEKVIPADSHVVKTLIAWAKFIQIPEDRPIFNITRQRVFQIVRAAGKKSGIEFVGEKKIHPHHFRHTFAMQKAKRLTDVGDLVMLRDLLCHSNIQHTTHYLSYTSEKMRRLVESN